MLELFQMGVVLKEEQKYNVGEQIARGQNIVMSQNSSLKS